MNFAIGFVLYNPNPDFINRLDLLKECGYTVYIFDNSPEFTKNNVSLNKIYNTKYLTSGVNLGLGIGITSVCFNAFNDSYESLLFFDQDTIFSKKTLIDINRFFEINKVIFGLYGAIQFSNKLNKNHKSENEFEIYRRKLLISSGCLFNLNNLHKLNWHNTNFFVDGVDYEFCLRASARNFLLGECINTQDFDHVSGQADSEYLLFGYKFLMRAYNSARIRDILVSYLKLICSSLSNLKFSYFIIFLRSFLQFSFFQLLVRILKFLKPHGRS